MLRSLWKARFFVISSIRTEFQRKFARSRLGALWLILNPLVQVMLFAFILSAVLSAKLPGVNNRHAYAIYLMAGTLGWSLFAEIVQRSLMMFLDHRNIIKKLPFPRLALPIIVVGSALINNLLLLFAMVVIFASLGHMPDLTFFWLPVLIILTICLAAGCGLILGLLNVYIRDLEQVVPLLMQFVFWLTPVVYMAQIIPAQYRSLLQLNPLVPLITSYQDVLVYHLAPRVTNLLQTAVIAVFLCIFSLFIFRKGNVEMADLL